MTTIEQRLASGELAAAMIGPRPGILLIAEHGYGHSNTKAFEAVDEDILLARGLSKDPLAILNKGVFVQGVPADVKTKIERDWAELVAGF